MKALTCLFYHVSMYILSTICRLLHLFLMVVGICRVEGGFQKTWKPNRQPFWIFWYNITKLAIEASKIGPTFREESFLSLVQIKTHIMESCSLNSGMITFRKIGLILTLKFDFEFWNCQIFNGSIPNFVAKIYCISTFTL